LILCLVVFLMSACNPQPTEKKPVVTPSVPLEEALLSLDDLETANPSFAALFASEPSLGEGCMVQNLDCQVLSFRSDGEPLSILGIEVTQFEDSEVSLAGSDSYQQFLEKVMGEQFEYVESEQLPLGSWYVQAGDTLFLGVPYNNLFLFFAVDTPVVEDVRTLAYDLAQAQIEKLEENGY